VKKSVKKAEPLLISVETTRFVSIIELLFNLLKIAGRKDALHDHLEKS